MIMIVSRIVSRPITIAERFRFHRRQQHEGESINSFCAELKKLARYCEFGTSLADSLRDRFVCGLNNDTIQKRLLAKDKLTLEKALSIATAMETAFKDTAELQSKSSIISGMHKLYVQKSAQKEVHALSVKESNPSDTSKLRGDDDDDEKMPSWSDYVMHFFTIFWKALFAFIPPTDCLGGWACFVSSIGVIGMLTALVGDLASQFGCTVGLKDSVTAISFVALGTSVPDTFASKVAALNDKYADSSIGNVTGSNAVNVFLGIGIAWSIAALHHAARGQPFRVHPGNLAFSVTLFCACAFVCCAVLMLRRTVGGELGGPMRYKAPTVALFVSLWLFYVLMSSLEAYGVIKGF